MGQFFPEPTKRVIHEIDHDAPTVMAVALPGKPTEKLAPDGFEYLCWYHAETETDEWFLVKKDCNVEFPDGRKPLLKFYLGGDYAGGRIVGIDRSGYSQKPPTSKGTVTVEIPDSMD